MGHALLMGRRTYESIGRPLPGRKTLVLSRDRDRRIEGVEVFNDLEEAIEAASRQGETELFVAGGGEIYRLALPHAHRIYLTRVHRKVAGDVVFPPLDSSRWRLVWEERHDGPDEGGEGLPHTFQIHERRGLASSARRGIMPRADR